MSRNRGSEKDLIFSAIYWHVWEESSNLVKFQSQGWFKGIQGHIWLMRLCGSWGVSCVHILFGTYFYILKDFDYVRKLSSFFLFFVYFLYFMPKSDYANLFILHLLINCLIGVYFLWGTFWNRLVRFRPLSSYFSRPFILLY